MPSVDYDPYTWDEWNINKPPQQFDREKFTGLQLVVKNKQIRYLICDIVDYILSVSKPLKILLFGSQARGDTVSTSDIDISVIFKRKHDITKRYYKTRDIIKNKSPIEVDIKSATVGQIKNSMGNMEDIYYYVMHDAVVLYQEGDNGLYKILTDAKTFLDFTYDSTELKITDGLSPYVVIKRSLGAVFLAGYVPIPLCSSNLQKLAEQLPNWKVRKICKKNELLYITKLVKPICLDDKNPLKSYKIAKKIYKLVLEECIDRKLLSKKDIKSLKISYNVP